MSNRLDADHDGIVRVNDITAVSHLEADLQTMTLVVEEEEKKRLDNLREKVEEIIEEEKEQDEGIVIICFLSFFSMLRITLIYGSSCRFLNARFGRRCTP